MRAALAWAFVVLVLAVFVEMGFRAFDHEWDAQMRSNQRARVLAEGGR